MNGKQYFTIFILLLIVVGGLLIWLGERDQKSASSDDKTKGGKIEEAGIILLCIGVGFVIAIGSFSG